MVSNDDFKKALGSLADGMTDDEIQAANERMSRLAGALFDMWNTTPQPSEIVVDHSDELAVK